ncbi:MAG: bifunctional phosphoribosylaminoimidazolecarboxamide formyltransferase/IMP cyclohydrolase [Thermoplasmatales archaeon]|nr:bifunctional phosphoribosylaminoimidazolecarboxamide formyltransferase/IMP cyclohydrolase [Thermoplasmatales archaeon]
MKPKIAIVSVYDKKGIEDFCRELIKNEVSIYASQGTKKYLDERGIKVKSISRYTGFSELLGSRIKTLSTKLHSAILARDEEIEELKKKGIEPVDMVVCNFYPYELGIDEMDIGGPAMVRAAAKNWRRIVVISSPSQYEIAKRYLRKGFDEKIRLKFAIEALQKTSYYDAMILRKYEKNFPSILCLPFVKKADLRYGENPHQKASFYVKENAGKVCISNAVQLQGKELSYNNILDANHAIECLKEFDEPTVVIVKHATPCGIASCEKIDEAWKKAFETDTYSPYGGIVAVNRKIDANLANEMSKIFLEVIIAPSFSKEALQIFKDKKNLRLLQISGLGKEKRKKEIELRSVEGGLLVQEKDVKRIDPREWKTVSIKKPSKEDISSMVFAVRCVRHVKSNAVVFVKDKSTVAIGGGQTSRVDAVWIATFKGKERIKGSIMASDAFFPFRDAVDEAAKAGVRVIVQPGGSIRDKEVIEAANEHNLIMVFTGQRCFLH